MQRATCVIALLVSLPASAWAQPSGSPLAKDALFDAAFSERAPASLDLARPGFGFAGQGAVTQTERSTRAGGHADTVRLTVAQPPAVPVATAAAPFRQGGYDLTFTRDWPEAVRLNAGAYDFGISPHASFGLSSDSRSAGAGAEVQLAKQKTDRLGDLGVRDGKSFGQTGRWYLFAAVSGKAVGLNMTRAGESAGWSTDPTSKLVGDGQLGVGWRKGGMQAAFGYVHREIKVQNSPHGADNDIGDSMAAFTLSIRPHK